jgi:hypothetical protein
MKNQNTRQFKIVDCHTNKLHHIVASDFDAALRQIARQLGHFCVAFV